MSLGIPTITVDVPAITLSVPAIMVGITPSRTLNILYNKLNILVLIII